MHTLKALSLVGLAAAYLTFPAFAEDAAPQAQPAPAAENQAAETAAAPVEELETMPDQIMGKADAPVTVLEYASMSCPHCAHFHLDVLPALKEKFVDTGKVRIIFRPYPLNAPALRGSMLAYCSGDDFFKFTKVLFETQKKWAFSASFQDALITIAKLGGMEESKAEACLNDKVLETKVINSRKNGESKYKIMSTPTFIINEAKLEVPPTVENFSKALEAAIAKAGAGTAAAPAQQ